MKRIFNIFIINIYISILIVGCSEKREISKDNLTDNLSIDSVVISKNETINEGNNYFQSGEFNTAIEFYKEAMQQNKATAYYNIGVSYYLLGNIEQAEVNFKEAVNEDPNFDEAVMNLVAVLAQQEKIQEAEKYVKRLIRTNKSARVYIDMANISLKNNNTPKALYYYKQALDIAPSSNFVLSNYANFLISVGSYQDGINILEMIPNKDFSINYNLALAYYKLNNPMASYPYAIEALYSLGATEEGLNKLAYLFSDLERYSDEANTLRVLIAQNPTKDYKIRLANSYINNNSLNKALDEVLALILDYPNDSTLYILNYQILILSMKIKEAGDFIRYTYSKLGGDNILYYYTRHLALYETDISEVKNKIFNNRENGWLNLSRTVYSLYMNRFNDAKKYLEKVPKEAGHDYYSYKTFLKIVDKQFREAELLSKNMNKKYPDTFWYKLVISWNLKQPDQILELANQYRDDQNIITRTPSFKYSLVPIIDDMGFTYKFTDKGADIVSMLAYPIFLEPDEVVQFLIMGKDTLNNIEKENATKKLEGMKSNNKAIDEFYNYNFDKALLLFKEAEKYLSNNTDVAYNIGLTYFNLGDNINAIEYFKKSIILNKDNPFPYLGEGLVNYRVNDPDRAYNMFEKARRIAQNKIIDNPTPSIDNIRLIYLSLMAGNRYQKREEALSIIKSDDAIVMTTTILMKYLEDYDYRILKELDNSPVFRVVSVQDLLMMRYKPSSEYVENHNPDRYYTLAKKYVMLTRGGNISTAINKKFENDPVYLKDMVYYSIFKKDKAAGLKYLQILTRLNFKYNELYKSSLYYFTWARDFVNAEASYGSLDRMGYYDRTTLFYMLLYFLANFNETRLQTYITLYEENYGKDYRSEIAKSIVTLNIKDIGGFYNIMNQLLKSDPYIFNKMFIELNFAKF